MRIRTVKPEFWANEKMSALPDFTRLVAIALLNYADDHGYFWANHLMMRGALFPFEEDSTRLRRSVAQLAEIGYLRLGVTPDGRECGHILKFSVHQRVDKAQQSKIQPLITFQEPSQINLGLFRDESCLDRNGMEGNGKDPAPAPPAPAAIKVKPPQPPEPPSLTYQRHSLICSTWGELFRDTFGVGYNFAGRDAATLKRFLTTVGDPVAEILQVARAAWERSKTDRFSKRCKEAATIHGLCTFYNEIRVELATPGSGSAGGVHGKVSSMAG